MIILKTSSEVKVTVTHNWYMTYHHPKMLSHTKCVIPTSKNIGDMHQAQCQFFELGQRWRSQWPKNGTLQFSSKYACTHQIWGLYLKWYERYASDTIIKKKIGQLSRSQWPENDMWHSAIPRCNDTPNVGFLSQIIQEICSRQDYSKN